MVGVIILVAIALLVVFWAVGAYNRLVSLQNQYKNSFAQIDVQLKRRYDLIPNLVETAKAYMKHEREALEAVIAARNQAVTANAKAAGDPSDAQAMHQLAAAEGALTSSLGKLFALSEAYPDLKANQNMMQLSEELASTENRVAFARQAFNDSVMAYNNKRETFPSSVVAGMTGFAEASLLEIPAEQQAQVRMAPKVEF